MHVIFFTKYTRMGASSRLRTFQYVPILESFGIQCTISTFFNDNYLRQLYLTRKHNKLLALQSFLKRCAALLAVRKYDLVIIEKELFPFLPATAETLLSVFKIPFLVDYDDAVWHNYDVSPKPLIRMLLRNKIETVMSRSKVVLAGNAYIRKKAIESGASECLVFPTVIDTNKYRLKEYGESKHFTIGWIGSPITFKYLAYLTPVFRRLSEAWSIKVKLIGAKVGIGLPNIEQLVPWSEESEASEIQSFNVGIMPLEDNIWERGKCGYKLIQYMGCGVPVIGTPLGVNENIIRHGENGFKATTLDQWYDSFVTLIEGGIEREKELGKAGHLLVQNEYSLEAFGRRYAELIKRCIIRK